MLFDKHYSEDIHENLTNVGFLHSHKKLPYSLESHSSIFHVVHLSVFQTNWHFYRNSCSWNKPDTHESFLRALVLLLASLKLLNTDLLDILKETFYKSSLIKYLWYYRKTHYYFEPIRKRRKFSYFLRFFFTNLQNNQSTLNAASLTHTTHHVAKVWTWPGIIWFNHRCKRVNTNK